MESDELSTLLSLVQVACAVGPLAPGRPLDPVVVPAPLAPTKMEVETPVTAAQQPVHHHHHADGAKPAVKAGKPAKAAAAVAAPPVKAKYVPPPVQDVPRRRREPEAGIKVPIAGQKNVLITSALPYVNNVPHLGNIIGCVLSADVYARFCRQRGVNCLYVCGTDEYGTATETKAQEEGLTPRAVCDKYFEQHKSIYDWFDISFDHFGRTSMPDPRGDKEWPQTQICQEIFKANVEAGNVTEDTVEQMYCTACARFLADRFIEGECPLCHYGDARGDQCDKCGKLLSATELLKPTCKVGKGAPEHVVEVRTSQHLFLDLPKLTPKLEQWVGKASVQGAWTDNAVQITKGWMRDGLKARCITRDLKWGTPVPHPGYEDKVFYVWFDAPIGYISITATYTPDHWRQWWMDPSNVSLYQFMGKDNIPFHTVIFPSSLIGTGQDWTLLHHVSTTEYLNYESGKFSKSRGVGVFGDSARDTGIPSEVWRYYLLANRPEASDSTFTWSDFAEKTNGELLKNLGNLVNRSMAFAHATFGGKTPDHGNAPLTEGDEAFIEKINTLLSSYITAMGEVKLKTGLKIAMEISMEGNGYMQANAAWELKTSDPARCAAIMSLQLSLVRLLSALLEPFMPGFTDKVLHFLDLPHIPIPDAFHRDVTPSNHAFLKPAPIFSALTPAQIEHFKEVFGGSQAEATAAQAASAAGAAAGEVSVAAGGGGGAGAAPTAAPAGKAAKGAAPAAGGGKGKGGGGGGKTKAAVVDLSHLPPVARVDLRVGKIIRAWPHPEADQLWCEEIDLGEPTGPRQIASGLRAHYKTAEELAGRLVCVVCNLKPRTMRGFESQGMVLCASSEDKSKVEFVDPPAGAVPGERLIPVGLIPADAPFPVPEVINAGKEGNPWGIVAPLLTTNADKVACFDGVPLSTSAGPCAAPTLAGVHVG